MAELSGTAGIDVRLRIQAQARERSLRLLDFLEAYFSVRFLPVYDINDYGDDQLAKGELDEIPGVVFSPGGDAWLSVDLIDRPDPPALPNELAGQIEGDLNPYAAPTLKVPAAEVGPSDVDQEELIDATTTPFLDPTEKDSEGQSQEFQVALDRWITVTWEPWSARYGKVEQGRSLYKRLFDLHTRFERERDVIEYVWGFGRLRWSPRLDNGRPATVDHPLLSVPVELILDQNSGRITVGPAGAAVVESAWTAGLPLTDLAGYNEQRTSAEDIEIDPWSPETRATLRALLRAVDHDGVLVDGEIGQRAPGAAPAVDPGDWVLFVRRRETNLRRFLEAQRQLYGDPEAIVPDPFAALVIDEPSLLGASASAAEPEGGDPSLCGGTSEERLLLPLPSNDEQLRILSLAQHRAGVTAQGPPGTGKSHTIANLISHYIAHGHRVLVTAEKEQALRVLVDKVPEAIRDLCVPVIGSDATSRAKLQATVTTIADAAHRRPDEAAIGRLTADLDEIERQIAVTTNALRDRRAKETQRAPNPPVGVEPVEWTPSTAAAWLVENRSRFGGIPDRVDPTAPLPLASGELVELDQLCGAVGPADAEAALADLPDPTTLPTGGRLATLRLEAEQLGDGLAAVDDLVVDWTRVDGAGPAGLAALAGELDQWADWHLKTAGTWLAQVLADASDPSLAAGWEEFFAGATAEREAALAAGRILAANRVAISTESGTEATPQFVAALTEARLLLANGRGVGRFHPAAKKALDACSVDERRPASAGDIDLVLTEVTRRTQCQRLATRWANMATRTGAPPLGIDRPVEFVIGEWLPLVRAALDWREQVWPGLAARLGDAGLAVPPVADAATVASLAQGCRSLAPRTRIVEITRELTSVVDCLRIGAAVPHASSLWQQLLDAFETRADTTWDTARTEATRLRALYDRAARRQHLHDRLSASAPQLASALVGRERTIDPEVFAEAWTWRQLEVWLCQLDEGPEPTHLQARLEQLSADRRRVTTNLVATKAWVALADSINDRRRTALNRFTTANAKIGKGTGRYVARWEAELRVAMDDAKDAVPVWIMPIHKVLSSFLPEANPPFDVIIIDEASQVGLLQLPVLALAKRAIVVGDDQQTSPENVGQSQLGIHELLDAHLGAISDRRTRFDQNNSLYDVARQQFPQIVQLREHFRCLPRIIEFSNHQWYNDTIVPLRDRPPRPAWQPLGTVFVPSGNRRGRRGVNVEEANATVDLLAELLIDPDYEGMSFGVINLLADSGQAKFVWEQLIDTFGPSVIEDRRIRIGDPASFQGDERDVIVLSTVVANDPEGRIGATNNAAAHRRINVAASRAKNQLWMVHSVGPDSFHRDDPRRALLEHCLTPAEDVAAATAMEKTESQFERDVLQRILDAGYTHVVSQYPVGGYRIDIVVEGPGERRLAVECDGDRWHGPEAWDHDRSRQAVLERAGWTFERIRGSAFYRDRNGALDPLWQRLDQLKIPAGDWAGEVRTMPTRRVWPDDFDTRLPSAVPSSAAWRPSGDIPLPLVEPAGFDGYRAAVVPTGSDRPSYRQPTSSTARESLDSRPSVREVRDWARRQGLPVGDRGRLHPDIAAAWDRDHPDRPLRH